MIQQNADYIHQTSLSINHGIHGLLKPVDTYGLYAIASNSYVERVYDSFWLNYYYL